MDIKTGLLKVDNSYQKNDLTLLSKSKTIDKEQSSAKKVAQEFEAMFAGMMIKSMRSTSSSDKLTGGGRGEEIYRSMLDQEYAIAMAKSGSIGLAKSIEKQILNENYGTVNTKPVAVEVKK